MRTSLTSPLDAKDCTERSYNPTAVNDTEEHKCALEELNDKSFTVKFKKFEKFLLDPLVPATQAYSLVSFVPSKNAKPDSDGVYGMLKVRGTYQSQEDADMRAEYLIRNCDTYHSIFHVFTGHPFPLCANKKYISETKEIDIKKKAIEVNSDEIRKKRNDDGQIMSELKNREEELLKDVDEKKEEDTLETYTETLVKRAQLIWTYKETSKKMEEMKKNIIKSKNLLDSLDTSSNGEFRKLSIERYREARKKSGLPDDDNSFIKYMCEDIDLGF